MVRKAALNLDRLSRPVPNKKFGESSISVTRNKAIFKSARELEDEFFDHAAFRGRNSEPASPQAVKLSDDQKAMLRSLKMQKKDQLDLAVRDLLIELCQYFSANCKYTGDADYVMNLLFNYQRGMINLVSLKNELKDVKAKYIQMQLDDFCEKYAEIEPYKLEEKPLENREKYTWTNNLKELLKFTDNVIYYKKRMVSEGKRKKQGKLVFINKTEIDENGHADESYKLTKFYQNQPRLC